MRKQKGSIRIGSILLTIVLIVILINSFNMFKKTYFNGFYKAVRQGEENTHFVRDSEVKYSESDSYKLENIKYNDSAFYKEIKVEPNTNYRISCMVKTENVVCENENEEGGATIGLLETTEYSEAIKGTNDWQYVEYMFNSRNRETVDISFRLGGNYNNCTGTAWFSELKVEKGTKSTDTKWNIGCFIINELNVNIEGKQYQLKINTTDRENIKLNLNRFKEDCVEFSDERMSVNCEIIEINTPVTSISYSEEHGYYLSYKDIKDSIYDIAKQKEIDHIFVVCRMENDDGTASIPIKDNWIGLGSMDIYGIGYSLVRINKNSNSYTYKYGVTNQTPEEVYIHEFCHTLERNLKEYGYRVPSLHDHEKYGYTDISVEGLKEWYEDYMGNRILVNKTGEYIGLDEFCYRTQPPNSSNFKYPIEIEFNHEPQNIIEEILAVVDVLKQE